MLDAGAASGASYTVAFPITAGGEWGLGWKGVNTAGVYTMCAGSRAAAILRRQLATTGDGKGMKATNHVRGMLACSTWGLGGGRAIWESRKSHQGGGGTLTHPPFGAVKKKVCRKSFSPKIIFAWVSNSFFQRFAPNWQEGGGGTPLYRAPFKTRRYADPPALHLPSEIPLGGGNCRVGCQSHSPNCLMGPGTGQRASCVGCVMMSTSCHPKTVFKSVCARVPSSLAFRRAVGSGTLCIAQRTVGAH
jgi:hypothetical protein